MRSRHQKFQHTGTRRPMERVQVESDTKTSEYTGSVRKIRKGKLWSPDSWNRITALGGAVLLLQLATTTWALTGQAHVGRGVAGLQLLARCVIVRFS